MKKFFFFLSVALCCSISVSAQTDEGPVSIGLKLGTNVSYLSTQFTTLKDPSYYMGLNAGAFVRLKLNENWLIQPELVYSQRGGSFTENLTGGTINNRMAYLEAPILIGYRPLNWLRFHVGPNFQYLLGAEENTLAAAGKIITFRKEALQNLVVGIQLGVGVDIQRFTFDLRYDTNLSSLGLSLNSSDASSNILQTATSRNNVWQIAVGYRLF